MSDRYQDMISFAEYAHDIVGGNSSPDGKAVSNMKGDEQYEKAVGGCTGLGTVIRSFVRG